MGLVQIPFIYGVNGFVRFKRGGERVQVVSHKFSSGLSGLCSYLTK